MEARARGGLDPRDERGELVGRAPGRDDLRLEMRDANRALLQLGDQLGHIVGHRDRLREALLLCARRGELGLQRREVGVLLGQLRRDLGPDLREHEVEHAFTEHVLLQVIDQRVLDLGHRLMNGDRADGVAALVVLRAAVAEDALVGPTVRDDPRSGDGTAAGAASRDTGQRVLRRGPADANAETVARREPLGDGEPGRVIDDPPLGDIDREDLRRIRLHADRAASLADLLDPTVNVDSAVARVEQDRPYRARCPRTATASTRRRSGDALVVQLVRDLLVPAVREVVAKDSLDDRRLLFVDDGDGVAAAGAIGLPLELVAVAGTAGDPTLANAAAKSLARPRTDRLELHLVPRALDEGRRLIDRVRELNLLTVRVIEQPAPAIADEVAHDEGHFDRVATETRLIAADDDVAALRIREQLAQTCARQEVIARAAIVHVVDVRLRRELHALDEVRAALRLDVEAELLLSVVVLRAPPVGANGGHRCPRA